MSDYICISPDVKLGPNVRLSKFINMYGCEIGENTKIGAFVEIQKNAKIGNNCKISSHTFVCEGVIIEDGVFIGHGVTFINDRFPRATTDSGELQTERDWKVEPTIVKNRASIGSGATILCNVTIGENAIVGAGSVVTRDVAANTVVAGNPARVLKTVKGGTISKGQISARMKERDQRDTRCAPVASSGRGIYRFDRAADRGSGGEDPSNSVEGE